MLGRGDWHVLGQQRGGGNVYFELAYESLSGNIVLDGTGQARVKVPYTHSSKAACCEVLNELKAWRDELVIYRDNHVAFVGPIISKEVTQEQGGSIFCQDLFQWMERRWIEVDTWYQEDVATVFRHVVQRALEPDPSPNIEVISHEVGVEESLDLKGKEFTRAADILRGLSRTALDFTTIGRTIYVGGEEVYTPNEFPLPSIVLVDGGVDNVSVTEDAAELATDVAVFGEAVFVGADNRIYGRATRLVEEYGLLQSSYAELEIRNTPAADANALARLKQLLPSPNRIKATLTPQADCEFDELLPGRRMDLRLAESGCMEVMQVMRLGQMSFESGSSGEKISVDLVPLGSFEDV